MTSYSTSEWFARFFLGLVIVLLMAIWRFNSPSWCRTYTSAARYHLALAFYVGIEALIYYVLAAVLLAMQSDGIVTIELLSPVLLAVVITSVLLPLLPPFAYWRRVMQGAAGVPQEAQRLGRALFDAEFRPSERVVHEVTAVLVRRGYDPEEHWLPVADSAQKLWLKAAVIFHQVRAWELDRAHAPFISQARNEFDILRQRFDQLSLKVSRTFSNIERLGTVLYRLTQAADGGTRPPRPDDDPEAKELLKKTIAEMLGNLREDIVFFLNNVCVLVARGVLTTELTENARVQRLQQLGFKVDARARPVRTLLYAFLAVIASMVLSSAVVGTGSDDADTKKNALRIVMIATIQITALAVPIVCKRLWGFANRDLFGRLPLRHVLGIGLAATTLAAGVGLVFRAAIFNSIPLAIADLAATYPWLLMAFTTAVTTTLLIQDDRWATARSRRAQQRNDAIVLAGAMVVSIYVVQLCFWLIESPRFPARLDMPLSEVAIGLIALLMGSLVGSLVPSAFREGRPSPSKAAAEAFPAALAAPYGYAPIGGSEADRRAGRDASVRPTRREDRL